MPFDNMPVVGVPTCLRAVKGRVFHGVNERYPRALIDAAGCLPLLIPAIGSRVDVCVLLDRLDGLLLTGSPSNVHPSHYGAEPSHPEILHDPERDATTLPLIREAIRRDLPILAICRGVQELNVALGGSLHQAVHDVNGHKDHRARYELPIDEMYGPVHPVTLRGQLRDWVGRDEIMVNSLHWQGISRLAKGLKPEAVAEDGLVEAVRGPDDAAFCLGVQWHPEWAAKSNPVSTLLFRRFGAAAKGHDSG